MSRRTLGFHRGLYRSLLFLYPPAFRSEYGSLMTQAFSDRLGEKGALRTWMLVIPDLWLSIPEQILEVSLMNQTWVAAAAAVGAALMLASLVVGGGPPITLVGLGAGFLLASLASICLFAANRRGRPTEFAYRAIPKRWTWWTVLSVGLAVTYVVAAAGLLVSDPKATNASALVAAIAFAAVIVGGLALRRRSRVAGNGMIALGAVPTLPFFWMIYPPIVGVAVIVGAVAEVARATYQGPATT